MPNRSRIDRLSVTGKMKTDMVSAAKRSRRTPEQLISDLEKRIASIKLRAEQKKVKQSPALRHVRAALKSIDKAMSESDDAATRSALDEVRSTLSACLSLNGVNVAPRSAPASTGGRRSSEDVERMSGNLLDYVAKNPGQRGEQIAATLGTDVVTMRLPMKKLIAENKIKTTGEKRGTKYYAR
jgi:hypothetical protein